MLKLGFIIFSGKIKNLKQSNLKPWVEAMGHAIVRSRALGRRHRRHEEGTNYIVLHCIYGE